ncbi:hypothetical protein A2976_01720 [candidate division WWE3 bacterium RIFCSPLOWO2_01_FULL_41_9]|uniref:Bacterial Ig-like domain-containing protein n=1 Tax=candidate division WWE3 bacterium RIFCSPLOWO2_01_FULL_41_9 TaxID=1802626 RepID=A0A1F4VKL7_UNCKA|nr:MAG: hypothetical protein A2976_01720 [candidate division WWE3 bacterium RIFCSPLOWO2_01_FULL_41_9]
MRFIRATTAIYIILTVFTLAVRHSQATSINVSLIVGDTRLTFQGKTSPSSQVTFTENNSVIGTTASDNTGYFEKEFIYSYPADDIHNITIYSVNGLGQMSNPILYSVFLSEFTNTTIGNLILPPTIALSALTTVQGTSITASGYTVPDSLLTLLFFNSATTLNSTSTADGYWEVAIDTTALNSGTHTVYGKTTAEGGYLSDESEHKNFIVTSPAAADSGSDDNGGDNNDDSSDSESGSSSTGTTTQDVSNLICALPNFLKLFDWDFNCKINFDEYASSARSWVGLWRIDQEPCDINSDGRCDIRDFSILLYHVY